MIYLGEQKFYQLFVLSLSEGKTAADFQLCVLPFRLAARNRIFLND